MSYSSLSFKKKKKKVYAKDLPEVAIKRLLLENILLLASRRPPMSDTFDFADTEVTLLPGVFVISFFRLYFKVVIYFPTLNQLLFRPIESFEIFTDDACKRFSITIWIGQIKGVIKQSRPKRWVNEIFAV